MEGGFATVGRFTDMVEAHIARGRLEAEGIQAMVIHEHHATANWFLSNALEGVKVQVHPRDAAAAEAILAELAQGAFELEDEAPEACPRCASTDIRADRRSRGLTLWLLWLFAVPLPYAGTGRICRQCGHRWKPDQP